MSPIIELTVDEEMPRARLGLLLKQFPTSMMTASRSGFNLTVVHFGKIVLRVGNA